MAGYANIIVDISHEKLDKTFQYIIPEHLQEYIRPGVRVDIPFGNGNRIISGYVVEVTEVPEFDVDKMKDVIGIRQGSKTIESQLIALAKIFAKVVLPVPLVPQNRYAWLTESVASWFFSIFIIWP